MKSFSLCAKASLVISTFPATIGESDSVLSSKGRLGFTFTSPASPATNNTEVYSEVLVIQQHNSSWLQRVQMHHFANMCSIQPGNKKPWTHSTQMLKTASKPSVPKHLDTNYFTSFSDTAKTDRRCSLSNPYYSLRTALDAQSVCSTGCPQQGLETDLEEVF